MSRLAHRRAFFHIPDQIFQEGIPALGECFEDLLPGEEVFDLVVGMKRASCLEVTEQLESGHDGLEDEGADIEPGADFGLADVELELCMGESEGHEFLQGFDGRGVTVDKVFQDVHVIGAGKELANRRMSVATRSPSFLGIVLEALREVVIVDVPDVRLIDPHPKCDRRHHDSSL